MWYFGLKFSDGSVCPKEGTYEGPNKHTREVVVPATIEIANVEIGTWEDRDGLYLYSMTIYSERKEKMCDIHDVVDRSDE